MKIYIILLLAVLSGCSFDDFSANVYSENEMYGMAEVLYGTVVSVGHVKVRENSYARDSSYKPLFGASSGAITGALVTGKKEGAAAGALVGGIAAVMGTFANKSAIEVSVRLEDGRTIDVIQPEDIRLVINERVRVVSRYGKARVLPL